MELLNLMFLSPKRGYLLLPNNNKPDNKDITKLTRGDNTEETRMLLTELEKNNVYSKTEDGCIYCRVMVERAASEDHIKGVRAAAGLVGMSKRWHNKTITKGDNKTITKDFPPASPRAEKEREKESAFPLLEIEVLEVIEYLNLKTGKLFRTTSQKTQALIRLRMKDGFSVANFKTVIDNQVAEWGNDKKMAQYLRPETLFGTKFESYLNSKTKPSGDGDY